MFRTGYDITTAITDLINAFAALIPICSLIKSGLEKRRNRLWTAAYSLFAANCLTGFIVHCFALPDTVNLIIWSLLYIVMGLMLAAYVSAVRYDTKKDHGFDLFLRTSMTVSFIVCIIIAVINVIDYRYSFPLFSLYGSLNVAYILIQLFRKVK